MPLETASTVVRLLHEARFGSLATLEESGAPYASFVAVALDVTGAPVLLLSDLARHARNLKRDPRVSLLVAGNGADGDPMDGPRVSVIGRMATCTDTDARQRFLARHEEAALYANFTDFGFYRLGMTEAHLVQGFGRISTLAGSAVSTDWTGAEELRTVQDGIVDHMNTAHSDAVDLYARVQLDAEGSGWRMLSIDPAGCDLMRDNQVKRLDFPQRITSSVAMREVLVSLAYKSRAGGKV